MNQAPFYDLVVVGSGPAGATTARFAANRGLRVLLIDKRQELGAPIQCSGAVSHHALAENDIQPLTEYIHEPIYGFGIYDQEGHQTTIDYRRLKPDEYGPGPHLRPLGYVVDRRRFDRCLMTEAERAGAEVWLKTEGLDYTFDPAQGGCLRVRRFNQEFEIRTHLLVGADGLQSNVARWLGIRPHIKLTELASCLQIIVDQVETDGLLEIITGHEWAPGGYAWVFPKGHGYAEIGLGVIRTLTERDAQWHLDHFLQHSFFRDRFARARVLEIQGGGVPLASPLKKQYAEGAILVGDAARHVNPITGGGIHTALSGGRIAGHFAADLIAAGQPAIASRTVDYQARWLDALGNKMWQLYDLKSDIFDESDVTLRDQRLYETMASYFSPDSVFKKV